MHWLPAHAEEPHHMLKVAFDKLAPLLMYSQLCTDKQRYNRSDNRYHGCHEGNNFTHTKSTLLLKFTGSEAAP
jgi:hypothetical protein